MPNDAPQWSRGAENPYLDGVYAPVTREVSADDLPVIGELPRDLNGIYLRNGPNPVFPPRGNYHWFDGDGMLHALHFEDGRASYRNRWIDTTAIRKEREAGKNLWPGYMDPPDASVSGGAGSDGWLKDTANTDIVAFGDRALALWYQCGTPYSVDPKTLSTHGMERFGGALQRQVSAHAKADPATGELMFFDYATRAPYLAYHVADADGQLRHSTPIELPGPRLPHDMAITENYSVLMDLPLFWNPELLARGIHKVEFFAQLPSRFGILGRRADGSEIRWFEAEPAYIYHVVNAWEEGDEIVMDACVTLDPCPAGDRAEGRLSRMLAFLRLEARLHRYRFNLKTGATREERIEDSKNAEFPSIDGRRLGRPSRYAYMAAIPEAPTLLFDGIVKFDTQTGSTETHAFGPGRYGSESPFAPRDGSGSEEDGYLVSFVTDRNTDRSEVLVIDAQAVTAPPVARIQLPQRVPAGFHACWIPA